MYLIELAAPEDTLAMIDAAIPDAQRFDGRRIFSLCARCFVISLLQDVAASAMTRLSIAQIPTPLDREFLTNFARRLGLTATVNEVVLLIT